MHLAIFLVNIHIIHHLPKNLTQPNHPNKDGCVALVANKDATALSKR